jgi:signal transduction histidine kinase
MLGRVFREELRYWLADGTERIADFAMHPIRDAAGAVILLHPTGIDITERKKAEEALRDADRRKDEFLATLAHELRNPLAPIRNALAVVNVAYNDRETFKRATEMMDRQLRQMVLIDDLLDVSRISRGNCTRKERVELAPIVQQAVEIAARSPKLPTFVTVTLPPEPVYLDADPIRLSQVLSNLLNNACKFTDRGGSIELRAEARGNAVLLSVKDNGIGIAADMLEHIFEIRAGRSVAGAVAG